MSKIVLPAIARTWPLVGRDDELRLFSTAIDDEECGGIALVGPAGVGKTRLAKEAAHLASLRRLKTVSIRASKSVSELPLAALAPLFAELDLDAGSSSSPALELAEAISRIQSSRMVLVVDDAQELDDPSVAVLDHLVARGGLFVIITARSGDNRPRGFHDMWKDEHISRIDIGPLHDADTASLLRAVLGGPIDRGAIQSLLSRSGGNVLFLRELVHGALEAGNLVSERGLWRLTEPLQASRRLLDLIEDRFRELSEPEREALELLALGEPLDLGVLSEIVPLQVVEDLERRGLIEGGDRYGTPQLHLAHPLYGEAVTLRLTTARRARLCRSLADACESSPGLRQGHALRIAVWRLEGGGGSPELWLDAAKVALRGDEYELAKRLARTAWDRGQMIEAAIVLSDALDLLSQHEELVTVLNAALLLAADDIDRTAIVTRLASALFYGEQGGERSDAILTKTAETVTDPSCRRFIEAQRGGLFLRTGNVAKTIEANRQLLSLQGDEAFAQACRDTAVAMALSGQAFSAIALAEHALSARQDLKDSEYFATPTIFVVAMAVALGEAGRLADAVAIAEAGYGASVERRNAHGQAWFGCILGLLLTAQGRLTSAEHLFKETATLFADRNHPSIRWGLGGIALTSGQRGESAAATEAVAEMDTFAPGMRLMDIHLERGRAWAAVAAGDLQAANGIFWNASNLAEQWGQLSSQAAVLHDLVRIGDTQAAVAKLRQLEGRVDGDLMVARLAYARAAESGDPAVAAQAADHFEACGALLFAAEAACLEHRFAAKRGLNRQASGAVARSQRLLEYCEGARTPNIIFAGAPSRLSGREREVALLAAEGLTSREIADRLFLSARTVDNHLQRIYLKLGVNGRLELKVALGSS